MREGRVGGERGWVEREGGGRGGEREESEGGERGKRVREGREGGRREERKGERVGGERGRATPREGEEKRLPKSCFFIQEEQTKSGNHVHTLQTLPVQNNQSHATTFSAHCTWQ